ncbi:ribonuclease H-like domain-containing protein [Tanacetum coccineum]
MSISSSNELVKTSTKDDDEASYHEDASENGTATNKPKQQQQQLIPTTTTISNIKLPILKKEEYDIWAMEMEHYLEYIDNDVWKVIQNGNSKKRISTGKDGVVRILPPVFAVEKERKARTILLMAIPKEHLRRFHGMDDAKEIWEAIRTSSDGLEKGVIGLVKVFGNHMTMMNTKPDVDTLSIDDLYNNLRVFEQELTSTSKSSASAQNVAFVSHSKSSNNKVKSGHTGPYSTYTPSTSSNNIPEREVPAGFADEVIYSLFAKQSEDLDLLHEDLEQIDDVDIEEMDINWQIAMIAIRMKKFYKKTGRRVRIDGNKPVGFDKKKLECFKCHNTGHFARECTSKGTNDGKKRDSFYQDQGAGKKEQNQNCLLTMDDGVVNWGEHTVEEEETNHALMAISSNNECTEEDFLNKPLYSRFSKTNNFKGVPHPLYGDYTPKPQEEIDDSLYVYGKKGPQKPEISDSDDNSMAFYCHQIAVKDLLEIPLSTLLIQLNAVRSNVNTGRANVNTVRANVNSVRQNVNSVRTNINTVRSKQPVPTNNTNSFSPVRPQGNWSTAVKTSAGYNWRGTRPNSNYNSGSNFVRTDHPLKNMEDRGIFDSGCSGHMTGNRIMDDFEECKGGSITFGGSKGYITGKGRIRVGVKLHMVLFTKTNCPVVSPDFKMPTPFYQLLIGQKQSVLIAISSIGLEELIVVPTAVKILVEKLDQDVFYNSKGRGLLEEISEPKRTKKQIREEQASLAEIARIQAEDEAENARREELKRTKIELAAKRLQEELELSEALKNKNGQWQEASSRFIQKKTGTQFGLNWKQIQIWSKRL